MPDDIKEKIKELPPEERIQKLKEHIEKEKKRIKEEKESIAHAEKLILLENEEIARQDKIQKELEQISLPKTEEIDIHKLFSADEDLEHIAKNEAPPEEDIIAMRQYESLLAHEPIENIYNRAKDIQDTIKDAGYMSDSQINEVNAIGYAIQNKREDIDTGKYKSDNERLQDILGSTESIIRYLRGE
jgi:hypothetical protein